VDAAGVRIGRVTFEGAGHHADRVEVDLRTGDLASVLVAADGTVHAQFETQRFDVNQLFDADGSAVVLHAGPDNFGNVPIGGGKYEDPNNWYNAATGTANTGDAGSRYGCAVVQRR
jgi:Cu-Zn family superoxide dismutase